MKNKGYTIMEAVIAMFLVVVMVGAVFSALMSSRRAIVTSSEKEEVYYSLKSTYGMLKDCRSNKNCQLKEFKCGSDSGCSLNFSGAVEDLKNINQLFTFNFNSLCKESTSGIFQYTAANSNDEPQVWLFNNNNICSDHSEPLKNFYVLDIQAQCTEAL